MKHTRNKPSEQTYLANELPLEASVKDLAALIRRQQERSRVGLVDPDAVARRVVRQLQRGRKMAAAVGLDLADLQPSLWDGDRERRMGVMTIVEVRHRRIYVRRASGQPWRAPGMLYLDLPE